ncbi:MAG: hypothetical protein ACRDRJ_25840 [Streptosporangiaceae bacterium]
MAVGAFDVKIRSSPNERVELARLTKTLSEVRLALAEIDRVYVLRGRRPRWVVSSLRDYPDSLLVRLTASPTTRRDTSSMLAPAEALVSGVDALQRVPEVPQYYTESTVDRVLKIGEPGQGVTEVSLATVNGQVEMDYVPVSEPVRQHAREAVRGTETSLGSVAGWLDQMNARRVGKGVLVVSLFDSLTRRAVTGYVPAAMESQVHQLWRRRVLARGRVTRNGRGQIVRINVEGFELLPEDDRARASVDELCGIDQDWIDGQDVDEYVREARRA